MALHINEIRKAVRTALTEWLIVEFEGRDMPAGTSWKHNKGWAAKNKNGVINYWTTPDSKDKADEFAKDSTKKKKDYLSNTSGASNAS